MLPYNPHDHGYGLHETLRRAVPTAAGYYDGEMAMFVPGRALAHHTPHHHQGRTVHDDGPDDDDVPGAHDITIGIDGLADSDRYGSAGACLMKKRIEQCQPHLHAEDTQ